LDLLESFRAPGNIFIFLHLIVMSLIAPSGSPLTILIVGAGVSGLVLAQGLRRHRIPFRIYERQSAENNTQGHRFRISKDGILALSSVLSADLQELLNLTQARQATSKPRYVDARALDFPAPEPASEEDSTPIDRAWIVQLLKLGIEDAIAYDKCFESFTFHDESVEVAFADGTSVQGRLLVGADGVKSRVRKQLQPDRKLLHLERSIVWGRTPISPALRKSLPEDVFSWFMALDEQQNQQSVIEAITWKSSVAELSEGRLSDLKDYFYFAICTHMDALGKPLPRTEEEKREHVRFYTADWHPALRAIFDAAAYDKTAWAPVISSAPDIGSWPGSEGRATIIGDAAHAMSPMGGSGGDTAIKCAADLARTIGEEGVAATSLSAFEERMRVRAKERIEHSFRGGQKFWRGKKWWEYGAVKL
jgi:2-polyprenyl-6-methoxyphenol hydroxylase-like FAD-dependent oxidoreductase